MTLQNISNVAVNNTALISSNSVISVSHFIRLNSYFCPRCHKKIVLPQFLKSQNLKAEKGVDIQCGDCKKGKVHIEVKNG